MLTVESKAAPSCTPSYARKVPSEATEVLELYKEEVSRLYKENDKLGNKIVQLQEELGQNTTAKISEPVANVDNSPDDEIESVEAVKTLESAECIAVTPQAEQLAQTQVAITVLNRHALCLRKILRNTKSVEGLATKLYSDLSYQHMQQQADHEGPLAKKDRQDSRWRQYQALLKGNFLFLYKRHTDRVGSQPEEVLHVDDVLIRVMLDVKGVVDPVLCLEIASDVDPIYVYVSSDAAGLAEWKRYLKAASQWWLHD